MVPTGWSLSPQPIAPPPSLSPPSPSASASTPLSRGGASRRSPSSIDSAASLLPQHLLRYGPRGVQGPPLVMNPPDNRLPPAFSASTPVVLRILPKAGSSAPIGYIYDPDPSRNEGKGGYLTLLLSSSPTKAMRFSGIFAPTSRRTAGLGGSRQPSLTWTASRTTSSPRVSIFWNPCAFLPTGTFLVCLL